MKVHGRGCRAQELQPHPAEAHVAAAAQGALRQGLRDALGRRLAAACVGVAGWQAHRVERADAEQDPRHPAAQLLGHDLRLQHRWQFCRLRRPGQHLLHLHAGAAQHDAADAGAGRARWLPVVLPVRGQCADSDVLWRLDMHPLERRDGGRREELRGPLGGCDERGHEQHGSEHVRLGLVRRDREGVGPPVRAVHAHVRGP
mmetsp:Transcript_15510/g.47297  ORF Transcript_15510/g.47297 Transcript_15510/m.47297 type:complete len:201 (-) Transcript_15510:865-1467(-)